MSCYQNNLFSIRNTSKRDPYRSQTNRITTSHVPLIEVSYYQISKALRLHMDLMYQSTGQWDPHNAHMGHVASNVLICRIILRERERCCGKCTMCFISDKLFLRMKFFDFLESFRAFFIYRGKFKVLLFQSYLVLFCHVGTISSRK